MLNKKMSYQEYRLARYRTMNQEVTEDGLVLATPTDETRAFEKTQARNFQFQGKTDLDVLFGVM